MEAHTKKIMQARTAMVLDQPFFGVLALRLKIVADTSCKTGWVDGRTLGYNPTWVESQTHAQLVGFVAHEVMHCACGHPWRRDNRDSDGWNKACDYAVNPILKSANFTLPENVYLDEAFDGKSAEWIYDRMPAPQDGEDEQEGEPEEGDDEQGEGAGSPGEDEQDDDQGDESKGDESGDESEDGDEQGEGEGDADGEGKQDGPGDPQGEVRDAPSDAADDGSTEGDWKAAVQQAANAAAAQGKLPGDLKRFASDAAKPKVDWRSALRRFVQEISSADYAWQRPNRRFLSQGLYLPSLHSEELGPIVIAIDTSGSIDDVVISKFNAEVQAIVDETSPARVHVMYADARVHRIDTMEREELCDFDKLDPVGNGGTAFAPVFDAVEELDEQPSCVIYLTDLWGSFPSDSEVPTLWATIDERNAKSVPFGEVLPIDA